MIKRFHSTANKTNSPETYMKFVYNYKSMGIMSFAAGILTIISSGIMLVEILVSKP